GGCTGCASGCPTGESGSTQFCSLYPYEACYNAAGTSRRHSIWTANGREQCTKWLRDFVWYYKEYAATSPCHIPDAGGTSYFSIPSPDMFQLDYETGVAPGFFDPRAVQQWKWIADSTLNGRWTTEEIPGFPSGTPGHNKTLSQIYSDERCSFGLPANP